jgi:hypothetical protein
MGCVGAEKKTTRKLRGTVHHSSANHVLCVAGNCTAWVWALYIMGHCHAVGVLQGTHCNKLVFLAHLWNVLLRHAQVFLGPGVRQVVLGIRLQYWSASQPLINSW